MAKTTNWIVVFAIVFLYPHCILAVPLFLPGPSSLLDVRLVRDDMVFAANTPDMICNQRSRTRRNQNWLSLFFLLDKFGSPSIFLAQSKRTYHAG